MLPIGYTENRQTVSNSRFVEAVWTYLAAERDEHRVLPDGRCDIILRFSTDDGVRARHVEPLIAGPSRKFHLVSVDRGDGFIGIRLRPGHARSVIPIDLSAIVDQVLAGPAVIEALPNIADCCRPTSIQKLAQHLTAYVAQRRAEPMADRPTRISLLIDNLHVSGGRLSVAELARGAGVDERTIWHDIKTSTGLSPKELAMVIQFHRAIRLIRDVGLDPANAALEAGYADQAHMTRVFRKLGGFTPALMPVSTVAGLGL